MYVCGPHPLPVVVSTDRHHSVRSTTSAASSIPALVSAPTPVLATAAPSPPVCTPLGPGPCMRVVNTGGGMGDWRKERGHQRFSSVLCAGGAWGGGRVYGGWVLSAPFAWVLMRDSFPCPFPMAPSPPPHALVSAPRELGPRVGAPTWHPPVHRTRADGPPGHQGTLVGEEGAPHHSHEHINRNMHSPPLSLFVVALIRSSLHATLSCL